MTELARFERECEYPPILSNMAIRFIIEQIHSLEQRESSQDERERQSRLVSRLEYEKRLREGNGVW